MPPESLIEKRRRLDQERDRRMRRAFLDMVCTYCSTSISGWAPGEFVQASSVDHLSGLPEFESRPDDALRIIRDLVRKGLIVERPAEDPRRQCQSGESFAPKHIDLQNTDKGRRLLEQLEPIDPEIFDLRKPRY